MALDQNTAEALAQAYNRGDFDQVNNLLGGGGISAQDVQSYFNFDNSQMADLGASGINFAAPPAPVYTPAAPTPVYEPVYETPVYTPPATNAYFQSNPDVAAAYAGNSYGMSADDFANFHYNNYGKNEGRYSPSGESPPKPVVAPPPEPVYTPPPAPTYTSYETESGTVYEPVSTPPAAVVEQTPVDTVAENYWREQAALQQAEWERQAAEQQREWERQAASTPVVTEPTPVPQTPVTTPSVIDEITAGPPTTEEEFLEIVGQPPVTAEPTAQTPTNTVKYHDGTTYDATQLETLTKQITDLSSALGTDKFWKGDALNAGEGANIGFDANTAAQILGTDTVTNKQQVALDMAANLNNAGIKNLDQIGMGDIKGDVTAIRDVDANGDWVGTYSKLDTKTGQYVPADANDIRTVTTGDGENQQQTIVATGVTGTGLINKDTGQAIGDGSGTIGSTYTGDGATDYKLKIDPATGAPIFYTTGRSTNDLANLMEDLGPIGNIGLAIATGGLSIPQQIAANMALQALSGKDMDDVIKNAVVSFAGSQIPGMDFMKDGASFIKDLGLSKELTDTLTRGLQNAVTSTATAALSGKDDLGSAFVKGFTTGGTGAAVNALLGNIEGFGDLTADQKKMVVNAVTGVVSGKPLEQVVINSAISAANSAIAQAKGASTTPTDTTKSTTVGDFEDTEVTRLKGLGYTKEQIQEYFNRLDNLTDVLDTPTTTPDTGTKVSDAITLPTGVQLASAGDGVFRTEVGGVPTYAESSNAATVNAPFGYTLLSMSESDNKPAGSYYDITANAWFKPNAAVTNLTDDATIKSDADLFNQAIGDLDKTTTDTSGTTGADITDIDNLLDSLASTGVNTDSGLSNQDILDMNNVLDDTVVVKGGATTPATDAGTIPEVGGGKATDVGGVTIVGDRPTDTVTGSTGADTITGATGNDNVETVTVTGGTGNDTITGGDGNDSVTGGTGNDTAPLSCPEGYEPNEAGTACIPVVVIQDKKCDPGYVYDEDLKQCVPIKTTEDTLTGGTGNDDIEELVVTDKKCDPGYVYDEALKQCVPIVTTPVVNPPVVKPPVVKPPVVKQPVVIPTYVPSGYYGASDKNEPVYAGAMDDFNLFATLQELLAEEPTKKDNKKSKDKTKMATGGHLDDLLAEQITVDDLLKLLR